MNNLKYIIASFFVFIIGVEFYLTIAQHVPLDKSSVLLLIVLITILFYRTKISWTLGIILFLYGIYNIYFISIKTAEPTTMQFTSPLNYLLYGGHTGALPRRVIDTIPDIFYAVALLLFLTKTARRNYHITA